MSRIRRRIWDIFTMIILIHLLVLKAQNLQRMLQSQSVYPLHPCESVKYLAIVPILYNPDNMNKNMIIKRDMRV